MDKLSQAWTGFFCKQMKISLQMNIYLTNNIREQYTLEQIPIELSFSFFLHKCILNLWFYSLFNDNIFDCFNILPQKQIKFLPRTLFHSKLSQKWNVHIIRQELIPSQVAQLISLSSQFIEIFGKWYV